LGLTLVAILTAALLLPGIIAARFFFRAADTAEIEVPVPSLSSPEGIALVGGFSVLVHFIYNVGLWTATKLPTLIPLPLADPYALFAAASALQSPEAALGLFAGLLGLCLTAIVTGYVAGRAAMLRRDRSFFYGPLTELLQAGEGDDKFITAYVISKLEANGKAIGYEGTIAALHRDGDGYPDKVVLKDVAPFSLTQKDGSTREEGPQVIDWLVLSAADWHNIAFRIFRVETAQAGSEATPAAPAPAPSDEA
jgi:hypothetical protein